MLVLQSSKLTPQAGTIYCAQLEYQEDRRLA